jgi:hypothetical protein
MPSFGPGKHASQNGCYGRTECKALAAKWRFNIALQNADNYRLLYDDWFYGAKTK